MKYRSENDTVRVSNRLKLLSTAEDDKDIKKASNKKNRENVIVTRKKAEKI